MHVKEQVAKALTAADGGFISGGELALHLGVSRNAVWKAIKALKADGYRVESIVGKGYRLLTSDVLCEDRIRCFLKTEGLLVQVHSCVTSTNRLAKTCAEQGAAEGTVIIAAQQTEGRGRLGRSFCSPPDTGLYMSVVLRPKIPASEALSITTAAAVAVCRAIEAVSPHAAQIKWVNDVFCEGKKVCGILTEASLDTETGGLSYAVLGIGINVHTPRGGFPPEIADIATALFEEEGGDRSRLAAAVLDAFFEEYTRLGEGRFVEEYRRRSLLVDRPVTVKTSAGDRGATALGVDEECRLLVRYDNGETARLSSGDVSIRL